MGTDFFRWLMMWICAPIYKAIPRLYSIFYFISNARFLSEGVVSDMSTNLYVLISVIMLFAFSANLLSTIVNPDLLSDNKKGLGAIFKRAIVGIILIVMIPVGFNLAYDFQGQIMKNSVIEKIILGINYSENAEEGKGGNGGQVIAGTLMYSVLYPATDNIEISADEDISQAYVDMIETDLEENIDMVADHINVKPADKNSDYKYAFKFDSLVALIAGIATLYILLLFAIDMAIRMFKLAFLELTAPISIMSYIAAGDTVFGKWRTEVLKTYADVYIRIAAMGFYLFMISHLDDFFNTPELWGQAESTYVESINGFGWNLLLKVIIIVGLLVFVKQVPSMIEKMLGVELKGGGIGGRLGEMAGVGKIAKQGWDTVTKAAGRVAGVAAGGIGLAALGGAPGLLLGGPAAIAGKHFGSKAWNEGLGKHGALKDMKWGQRLRKSGAWLKDGSKGVRQLNENDEERKEKQKNRQYEKRVAKDFAMKDKTRNEIEETAGNVNKKLLFMDSPDKDGTRVLDTAHMKASDATTGAFSQLVEAIRGLSQTQKEVLKGYNEKQNKLMTAQNDETYGNQIRSYLASARDIAAGSDKKQAINDILAKFNSGNMTARELSSSMSTAGLSTDIQTIINDSAKKMSDTRDKIDPKTGEVTHGEDRTIRSEIALTASVNNAQLGFDGESAKLDKAIENAANDAEKMMLKEMKSNSKKMNKKNTGTL